MKHALLVMFVTLAGCAYGVEDELPPVPPEAPQAPAPKNDPKRDDEGAGALPCDRREVVTFVVNGRTIRFEVPSLCDPTPYIEKGDPPPWASRNEKFESSVNR